MPLERHKICKLVLLTELTLKLNNLHQVFAAMYSVIEQNEWTVGVTGVFVQKCADFLAFDEISVISGIYFWKKAPRKTS